MKAILRHLWVLPLSIVALVAPAKDAPLQYKFKVGETNVYRIEFVQLMESGTSSNSGNIFVSVASASSNVFRLNVRGNLEVRNASGDRGFPPYYGGGMSRWNGGASLGDGCEMHVDANGNPLRVAADYPLPLPLGTILTELVQPIPASGRSETTERNFVLDAPLWLGPAAVFGAGQSYGPPYYMNYGPRQVLAPVAVMTRTEWKPLSTASQLVTLRKTVSLQSLLKFNNEPQITANGAGEVVFDLQKGLINRVEMNCSSHGLSEAVSRENRITLKIRLLEGKEREDVLTPPAPPVPQNVARKLSADDVQGLINDLKASDADKQRAAINRVRDTDLEQPSAELMELVAGFALHDDTGIRQAVAAILLKGGTTNQTTILIKLLKDSDENVVQTAAKALGRLKDGRAIEPLVDLLAGGARMNQYNQIQNYQFIVEIATALQNLGSLAEGSVKLLLSDRNNETRRQASIILKQIGTETSIEALQKVVGDPNPQLNQAAAEAIRAIKQRQ
jgi:hypothetical protein